MGDHIPSLHDWCGNLVPVVFFASHEAHSQGEGNCQSLLGTQSLQASWLEKHFLLIDRRACCIHPVNIETHFNTGALLITTPLEVNVFSAAFYIDFHMICRFTGWLVPWQSAVERVFSGENLHQCGSG